MQGVTSVQPITDLSLWLRFFLGSAAVLWLPGYLLVGRHLRFRPAPTRHLLSLCAGLLMLPLWAQFASQIGIGVRPLQYLPVAVLLAAGIGATPAGRRVAQALDAEEPGPTWMSAALIVSVVIPLACIVFGFNDFVVPPTTHDAANHAYMTLRITQTGTVLASEVFGPPHGAPDLPYAMGLHAIASMLAQTTGLAPYVAVWFLALAAVTLIPLSLSILWDEWRLPAIAVALATLFVAANPYAPARFLWWGLFASAVGLLLVPICTLLLERFWRSASVGLGVAAGMATGSLMLVHGSEVPTAGIFALATIVLHRRTPNLNPTGWAVFVASAVVAGWYFLAGVVPSYLTGGIESGQEHFESLATTADRSLRVVGEWPLLQALGVFSIVLGLARKPTRVLAIFVLAILLVVTALALWRDSFTGLLTTPYYRQPERVRYLLVFLVPALMGVSLHWLWLRSKADTWSMFARAGVAVALVSALVLPELPGIVERYENKKEFAPFSADDFSQAQKISSVVGPEDWILNQFFDGSSWLMHIADSRLLVPTGWRMTDPTDQPNRLLLKKVLRGMPLTRLDTRFQYLYVSDLRTGKPRGFTRARVDPDERFEAVLVGRHSTLYRIQRPDVP